MERNDVDRVKLAKVAKCVEYFSSFYTRIALRLGVDRSLVCRVARGERRSARIGARLVADFERFQRELMKDGSNRDVTDEVA